MHRPVERFAVRRATGFADLPPPRRGAGRRAQLALVAAAVAAGIALGLAVPPTALSPTGGRDLAAGILGEIQPAAGPVAR